MLVFLPSKKIAALLPQSSYWESTLLQGATKSYLQFPETDSSNNIYCVSSLDTGALGLCKYNSAGVLQWVRSMSGSSNPTAVIVRVSDSAVFVLSSSSTASTVNNAGKIAANLFKYDHSGNLIWKFAYGTGSISSVSYDVALTNDGHLYMSLHTPPAVGGSTPLILKLNSTTGDIVWQRRLGANCTDSISIAADGSGNCYATARSYQGSTTEPPILVKISAAGAFMWGRRFHTAGYYRYADAVRVTPAGDVLLTYRQTQSNTYVISVFTTKYTSEGVFLWDVEAYGLDSSSSTDGKIAVDSQNNSFMLSSMSNSYYPAVTKGALLSLDANGATRFNNGLETSETSVNYGFAGRHLTVNHSDEPVLTAYHNSQVVANSAFLLMSMRSDGARIRNSSDTRRSVTTSRVITRAPRLSEIAGATYTIGVYESTPTVAKGISPLVDSAIALESFTSSTGPLQTY